jgi:hypothetical protein
MIHTVLILCVRKEMWNSIKSPKTKVQLLPLLTRQAMWYNTTMKRVRVTIVAVENH